MSPDALELATEHQLRARSGLAAALREGPSHAYLITGPAGSGKVASTRAFAAEILAEGSPRRDRDPPPRDARPPRRTRTWSGCDRSG